MTEYFQNMDDLLQYYYGDIFARQLKKDSDVTIGDSGMYSAIFGPELFREIVLEDSLMGALTKKPWKKSGYRVVTTAGETSGGGVADGGSVPATVEPTAEEITMVPKLHSRTVGMGVLQNAMAGKDDVVTWDGLRRETEDEFKDVANRALLTDVTTTAGNNFESLDRVCSSKAEEDDCSDVDAGDNDIYGIDRDAATTYDAYVSENNNSDRTFTVSLVDTVLQNVDIYWRNGEYARKFIVTGRDTLFRWGAQLAPRLRFGSERVQFGVNGIQSMKGVEGGVALSSYLGIPVITDARVVQDTISRIYVVDQDTCWFGLVAPVMYSEVGNDEREQILLGKHAKEGMFTMKGELVCTQFHNQGKVRDLK